MNTTEPDRWSLRRLLGLGVESPLPSAQELVALGEILQAVRSLDYGTVQAVVHGGRVVEIDTTRKRRL